MEAAPQPLILVVDDDASLRDVLADYFSARGYRIHGLPGTQALDRALNELSPAVLVLDRMMPGEDGVAACRRLRARDEDVPVILLTAIDEPIDRVVGLESGADDYVGKPFDPRELEARVAALLRRPRRLGRRRAGISFGVFEFEPELRILVREGVRVPLAPGEAALFAVLAARPNQPLSRDEILELAGADIERFDRAVDSAIYRLRRILEDDPVRPRFLRTVRGVGYVFEPQGQGTR